MRAKSAYWGLLFLLAIWLGNINQILEVSPKNVGSSFMAYSVPIKT